MTEPIPTEAVGELPRQDQREPTDAELAALARDLVEEQTGRPAYLCDDEAWEWAMDEATIRWQPPKPLSPVQEAIRKAQGTNPTHDEITQSIDFLNRVWAAIRKGGDDAR